MRERIPRPRAKRGSEVRLGASVQLEVLQIGLQGIPNPGTSLVLSAAAAVAETVHWGEPALGGATRRKTWRGPARPFSA
jgi:hypothetical protein